MRKVVLAVILTGIFLGLLSFYNIHRARDERKKAPSVTGLEEGDKLFGRLKFSEAAAVYESALKKNPADYEALWRLARCYTKWGILRKDKRRTYIPKAIDYARGAIKINDKGFEGHLYLAESLGTSLKYEGPRNRVYFIKEVRREAQRAMALNPQHFKPYLILGIWHKKVADANWFEKQLARIFLGGLPEASLKESERNLKKSMELKPDFIKTHYELALLYQKLNDNKLAIKELEAAVNCPVTDNKERNIKRKSAALLTELKLK